jgi:hypothetical protein
VIHIGPAIDSEIFEGAQYAEISGESPVKILVEEEHLRLVAQGEEEIEIVMRAL